MNYAIETNTGTHVYRAPNALEARKLHHAAYQGRKLDYASSWIVLDIYLSENA